MLSATYTPPGSADIAAGQALLSLRANPIAPCSNFATDNLLLQIQDQPQANAGADRNVCAGSYTINDATATNYSTVSWIHSGAGTLTNPGSLTLLICQHRQK